MSEEKLMPCPNPWCCPSDQLLPAVIWVHSEALVQCESCGMQGPGINPVVHDDDGEVIGTRDAEADAITAWNTRHPTPAADEVEIVWNALKEQCCSDPVEATKCVMVGKDQLARAMQARSAEPAGEEPVATIRYANVGDLRNEMPKVMSCVDLPDGDYHVYLRPAPSNPERLVDWRGHCEWLLDLDEIHVGEGETDVLARIASIRAALSAAPLKEGE